MVKNKSMSYKAYYRYSVANVNSLMKKQVGPRTHKLIMRAA